MRFSTAQIKKLPPALLTFSFISGFLGGAAVGSALHLPKPLLNISPLQHKHLSQRNISSVMVLKPLLKFLLLKVFRPIAFAFRLLV
jgi:uncharacterized membrane protein